MPTDEDISGKVSVRAGFCRIGTNAWFLICKILNVPVSSPVLEQKLSNCLPASYLFIRFITIILAIGLFALISQILFGVSINSLNSEYGLLHTVAQYREALHRLKLATTFLYGQDYFEIPAAEHALKKSIESLAQLNKTARFFRQRRVPLRTGSKVKLFYSPQMVENLQEAEEVLRNVEDLFSLFTHNPMQSESPDPFSISASKSPPPLHPFLEPGPGPPEIALKTDVIVPSKSGNPFVSDDGSLPSPFRSVGREQQSKKQQQHTVLSDSNGKDRNKVVDEIFTLLDRLEAIFEIIHADAIDELEGNLARSAGTSWFLLILLFIALAGGVRFVFMPAMQKIDQEIAMRMQKEVENCSLSAVTKLKSEFLSVMSHEIRTPLTGILGCCEVLLSTDLSQSQMECTSTISACGQSLLVIINDILDFSKIESGKMTLDNYEFALIPSIEEVLELQSGKAVTKGLDLALFLEDSIQSPIPWSFLGDAVRFKQILTNLIGNAIKFTTRGSVVVRVSEIKSLDIEERECAYVRELKNRSIPTITIRVEVEDTGVGMTPEQKKNLFEAFVQGDRSINRKFGGTGLGLTISKKLCTLMGGDINLTTLIGEGTKFWFTVVLGIPTNPLMLRPSPPRPLILTTYPPFPPKIVSSNSFSSPNKSPRTLFSSILSPFARSPLPSLFTSSMLSPSHSPPSSHSMLSPPSPTATSSSLLSITAYPQMPISPPSPEIHAPFLLSAIRVIILAPTEHEIRPITPSSSTDEEGNGANEDIHESPLRLRPKRIGIRRNGSSGVSPVPEDTLTSAKSANTELIQSTLSSEKSDNEDDEKPHQSSVLERKRPSIVDTKSIEDNRVKTLEKTNSGSLFFSNNDNIKLVNDLRKDFDDSGRLRPESRSRSGSRYQSSFPNPKTQPHLLALMRNLERWGIQVDVVSHGSLALSLLHQPRGPTTEPYKPWYLFVSADAKPESIGVDPFLFGKDVRERGLVDGIVMFCNVVTRASIERKYKFAEIYDELIIRPFRLSKLRKILDKLSLRKPQKPTIPDADESEQETVLLNRNLKTGLGLNSSQTINLTQPLVGDNSNVQDQSKKDEKLTQVVGKNKDKDLPWIIVAEDNVINQRVLKSQLSKLQGDLRVQVEICENGQEVLDKLSAHVGRYSLILMDINMPIMGGMECTREIRHLESLSFAPPIPIIASSAADLEEKTKCLAAGMNDFCPKPTTVINLGKLVKKYVKKNLDLNIFEENSISNQEEERNETEKQQKSKIRKIRKLSEAFKQSSESSSSPMQLRRRLTPRSPVQLKRRFGVLSNSPRRPSPFRSLSAPSTENLEECLSDRQTPLGFPSRSLLSVPTTSDSTDSTRSTPRRLRQKSRLATDEHSPRHKSRLATDEQSPRLPISDQSQMKGLTCLLVDDNKVHQAIIKWMLERLGIYCFCCSDGHEALEALTASKVDIILLDCLMNQGMDGYETAKSIRARETEYFESIGLHPSIPLARDILASTESPIIISPPSASSLVSSASPFPSPASGVKPILSPVRLTSPFSDQSSLLSSLSSPKTASSHFFSNASTSTATLSTSRLSSPSFKSLFTTPVTSTFSSSKAPDNAFTNPAATSSNSPLSVTTTFSSIFPETSLHATTSLSPHSPTFIPPTLTLPLVPSLTMRRTPIIALSAHVVAENQKKCFDAGMDDFLAKPVLLLHLANKLAKYLPI